jgi:hypothetical protein
MELRPPLTPPMILSQLAGKRAAVFLCRASHHIVPSSKVYTKNKTKLRGFEALTWCLYLKEGSRSRCHDPLTKHNGCRGTKAISAPFEGWLDQAKIEGLRSRRQSWSCTTATARVPRHRPWRRHRHFTLHPLILSSRRPSKRSP